MTVREDILRLLEEHGGEFRAPEGNAGRLIAEAVGADYNLASTTLYRMVRRGELEKVSEHPRRAYAYRLPAPATPRGNFGEIAAAERAASHIPLRGHTTPAAVTDELAEALLNALEQHRQRSAGLRSGIAEVRQALQAADAKLWSLEQGLAEGHEPPSPHLGGDG